MICPHCGNETKIPDVAYMNVETYRSPKLTVTGCCGKGVYLHLVVSFRAEPDRCGSKQDAWGHKLKPA